MIRKKHTRLDISGLLIVGGSDTDIAVSIAPIPQASDIRRTVNGDAVNLARTVFRKYSVNVSGSGFRPPALLNLNIGDYCEILVPDLLTFSNSPTVAPILPRAGVDVRGITQDGETVRPFDQPADPRPLQKSRTAARLAALRNPGEYMMFENNVVALRFQPVFACIITGTSISQSERTADSSWTISMEEI
jgi:hypothetical protein